MFAAVLNIDQRLKKMGGSTTIVCDNSANVSICNTHSIYVAEMRQIHNTNVATIGGKGYPASGISTVKWRTGKIMTASDTSSLSRTSCIFHSR